MSPVLPEELENQELIRVLRESELTRLRTAAEQWQKGLAGVVGVISTVLLIKGPQSITDLQGWAQITIGLLFGLAILLGIGGLISSLLAAYGAPLTYDASTAHAASQLRSKLVGRAKIAFYAAAIATVTSALLVLAAVGISWFAVADPAGPFIRIETTDGPACGVLESANGTRIVLSFDDRPHTFPMADVSSLAVVDSCGPAAE